MAIDDEEALTLYVINDSEKDFTSQDIAYMQGAGFWHHKASEDFNRTENYPNDYSYFGISVVG